MLLRTTLAALTRMTGVDNVDTLVTQGSLINALLTPGEYADAETLGRGTLDKMRRILGRGRSETITTRRQARGGRTDRA